MKLRDAIKAAAQPKPKKVTVPDTVVAQIVDGNDSAPEWLSAPMYARTLSVGDGIVLGGVAPKNAEDRDGFLRTFCLMFVESDNSLVFDLANAEDQQVARNNVPLALARWFVTVAMEHNGLAAPAAGTESPKA